MTQAVVELRQEIRAARDAELARLQRERRSLIAELQARPELPDDVDCVALVEASRGD